MNDLPSNIALLMRRSTDGGKTWEAQQTIREEPAPNGFGDPGVLVDRETDRIFTPPASAATRTHELSVRYTTRGSSSSAKVQVGVTGDPAVVAPAVDTLPVLDAIYTAGQPGLLDDSVAPWIRVTNTGNTSLAGVRITGPGDNLARCNFSSLAPGQSYVCKTVRYPVTAADLQTGSWKPEFTVEGTTPDGSKVTKLGSLTVDLTT